MELTKTLRYVDLLSLYEDLLSSTQKEILSLYYKFDLSLSEIAEERSVSRAAVEDAIKKGNKKLDEFEASLKLLEKKSEILKNTAIIKQKYGNCKEIEQIERIIK